MPASNRSAACRSSGSGVTHVNMFGVPVPAQTWPAGHVDPPSAAPVVVHDTVPGSGGVHVSSMFASWLCTEPARAKGTFGLRYDVLAAVQSALLVWWKNVDAA